jgi:hypothetical protein
MSWSRGWSVNEQGADEGDEAFGQRAAGLGVGVGGQIVELAEGGIGGDVPQHVRVRLEALGTEHPAHHDEERAVGVGEFGSGDCRGELGWHGEGRLA